MSPKELLEKLGFNANEINTYLALIELGRASASEISKSTSIPRTTTYSVLENLTDKGLASIEKEPGTSRYVAQHPTTLLRLVEKEKEVVRTREGLAGALVEAIEPYFRGKNFNVPRLQFFDGTRNVENMLYDQLPKWERSMVADDRTLWGYQDHTFVEQHGKWLKHHWQRIKKHRLDLRIQLFSNKAPIEDKLKGQVSFREIRPFPVDFQFDSSIWICGDYIIMIITRDKPHYAFQIRDARFAKNLKVIFQLLWNLKSFPL